MLEDKVTLFLKKFVLGREVKLGDSDEVIRACISRAYSDMMTAGKYVLDTDLAKGDKAKTERNNGRKESFFELLQDHGYAFSRELISDTCELFGSLEIIRSGDRYATRWGLAQKLVNMTFKYLYVFSEEVDAEGKAIDFSVSDCPLDSVILDAIEYKGTVWSRLDIDTYLEIQDKIDAALVDEAKKRPEIAEEKKKIGRLLYDFIKW